MRGLVSRVRRGSPGARPCGHARRSFPSAARSRGRDQPLLKIRRRPQSGVESSHSLWLRAVTLRDAVYRPLIAYTNSRSQDSTFSWSALFLGSARRDGRRRRPHGGNRGSGTCGEHAGTATSGHPIRVGPSRGRTAGREASRPGRLGHLRPHQGEPDGGSPRLRGAGASGSRGSVVDAGSVRTSGVRAASSAGRRRGC